MTDPEISTFRQIVWEYYGAHGRHDLPWREPRADGTLDPFNVVVSELMLQQTQVRRVLPKFEEFMQRFPSFKALADASLADVLRAWSGLGYNRRAKFLWQTAWLVERQYAGRLPADTSELVKLPGIGPNTAGAIMAYAYNLPVLFIETNIRSVFIYHFFADQEKVTDKQLIGLVAQALPQSKDEGGPREWYWALMDYGAHLKQTVGNTGRSSASYTRQSRFAGSRRQVRGQVLKHLGERPRRRKELRLVIADDRLDDVLADLTGEGFIEKHGPYYRLHGA